MSLPNMPNATPMCAASISEFAFSAGYAPVEAYRSVDIQRHLRDVHRDRENDWFEPTPDLEGDIVEVSSDTLKANIALVKQEPATPTEEEDEEDYEED